MKSAISNRYQYLEIIPIRLIRLTMGHYPAERNPLRSYATSVSATIMPRLYCGNWKIKIQATFFKVAATKNM